MYTILFLLCLVSVSKSENILAIFPHPGKTHFDVFQPLILQLAARGHDVTVLSFFPLKTAVPNYTDISLVGVMPVFMNAVPIEIVKDITPKFNFMWTMEVGSEACHNVIKSQQVQDLIKSGKKFDLIIIEVFNSDCFFSLVEIFHAPYVGFSSCMTFPHHHHRIGNPDSFAFASNVMTPYSRHMTFTQRLMNTLYTIGMQAAWVYYYHKEDQKTVDREIGRGVSLGKSVWNASLILVNSHYSLHGSRPMVPGLIEVGGLNIVPPKSLNKPLVRQLAARGHDMTVLSFFPLKTAVPNYTDISLVGVMPVFMNAVPIEIATDMTTTFNFVWTMEGGQESCRYVIKSQQVQDLIKSRKKFDLIIIEVFNSDCFFSLVEIFQAPYVGFSSCLTFPQHNFRIGNPDSFAFVSNVMTPYSRHMTFTQRLMNTLYTIGMQAAWVYYYHKEDQKTVDREVGRDVSLVKSAWNASVILVNSHYSLHGSRPMLPGLIEVRGLNIAPPKPLSKVQTLLISQFSCSHFM